jgi:hypothetical protein
MDFSSDLQRAVVSVKASSNANKADIFFLEAIASAARLHDPSYGPQLLAPTPWDIGRTRSHNYVLIHGVSGYVLA